MLLRPLLLLAVVACARAGAPALATLPDAAFLKELIATADIHAEVQSEVREKRETVHAAAQALDVIIDFILAGAVPQIISHGKSTLAIPNLSFYMNMTLLNIEMNLGLTAAGGSVQDIKSLFRQGSAVLRRGANGLLLLDATVGIRMFRLAYTNYKISFNGMKIEGQIQVEVSPATVSAQVALMPPCSAQLRLLRVAQLGPVRIKVTGLPKVLSGLPKWLEGVVQYVASLEEVRSSIMNCVAKVIARELQHFSC